MSCIICKGDVVDVKCKNCKSTYCRDCIETYVLTKNTDIHEVHDTDACKDLDIKCPYCTVLMGKEFVKSIFDSISLKNFLVHYMEENHYRSRVFKIILRNFSSFIYNVLCTEYEHEGKFGYRIMNNYYFVQQLFNKSPVNIVTISNNITIINRDFIEDNLLYMFKINLLFPNMPITIDDVSVQNLRNKFSKINVDLYKKDIIFQTLEVMIRRGRLNEESGWYYIMYHLVKDNAKPRRMLLPSIDKQRPPKLCQCQYCSGNVFYQYETALCIDCYKEFCIKCLKPKTKNHTCDKTLRQTLGRCICKHCNVFCDYNDEVAFCSTCNNIYKVADILEEIELNYNMKNFILIFRSVDNFISRIRYIIDSLSLFEVEDVYRGNDKYTLLQVRLIKFIVDHDMFNTNFINNIFPIFVKNLSFDVIRQYKGEVCINYDILTSIAQNKNVNKFILAQSIKDKLLTMIEVISTRNDNKIKEHEDNLLRYELILHQRELTSIFEDYHGIPKFQHGNEAVVINIE